MDNDKKDSGDEKKRKPTSKTGTSSPSRVARPTPSSSDNVVPKRAQKSDSSHNEAAWVPATVLRSPRGNRKQEQIEPVSDDNDSTYALDSTLTPFNKYFKTYFTPYTFVLSHLNPANSVRNSFWI